MLGILKQCLLRAKYRLYTEVSQKGKMLFIEHFVIMLRGPKDFVYEPDCEKVIRAILLNIKK